VEAPVVLELRHSASMPSHTAFPLSVPA